VSFEEKNLIQVFVMTSKRPSSLCLTPVTTALTSIPRNSRILQLAACTQTYASGNNNSAYFLMSTNVAYAEVMLINCLWKVAIMLCRWHHHRKQKWCLHIVYQYALYVTVRIYAEDKKEYLKVDNLAPTDLQTVFSKEN